MSENEIKSALNTSLGRPSSNPNQNPSNSRIVQHAMHAANRIGCSRSAAINIALRHYGKKF